MQVAGWSVAQLAEQAHPNEPPLHFIPSNKRGKLYYLKDGSHSCRVRRNFAIDLICCHRETRAAWNAEGLMHPTWD